MAIAYLTGNRFKQLIIFENWYSIASIRRCLAVRGIQKSKLKALTPPLIPVKPSAF